MTHAIIGRWAGIDYGRRRIGAAYSDFGHRIASPAGVLPGSGSVPDDAQRVLSWGGENEIAGFVVGLPLNMDGTDSEQTKLTRAFITALQARTDVPIAAWDERLSSFQADEWLNHANVSPKRRKQLRDALAAQVILQSFLDAQRTARKDGPDAAANPDVDNAASDSE